MAHSHSHHGHSHNSDGNLKLAFFLNLGFTVFRNHRRAFIPILWAILSDAVHDLGDSFSLGLAWYLNKKSKKPLPLNFPFGYQAVFLGWRIY